MPYKEINDLRKKGFLEDAMRMAETEYAASPDKLEATALFWCLNDLLKRSGYEPTAAGSVELLSRMRELRNTHDPENTVTGKALSVAENMILGDPSERQGWQLYQDLRALDSAPADEKWPIIEQYAEIMNSRPSLLHSLMMGEAIKLEKASSRGAFFIEFVQDWDIDNLRPEDWVQNEGKDFHKQSSLVEKIIGAYMSALNYAACLPDEKFCSLLDRAIEAYPTNLHLYRYSAQLMDISGNHDAAIETLRRMIELTPDKHYLWDDLSKLIDDPDLRIGILCNAIIKTKGDELALNLRLRLADSLCEKGYYANALTELNKFREVIEYRGWTLKRWYYDVLHLVPYGIYPIDNAHLYAEFTALANAYVFQDLPADIYVKVWEQRTASPSKADSAWMLRHENEELWIKPKKFCLPAKARNGSVFLVHRSSERRDQIVCITPTRLTEPLHWLKIVKGPVAIKNPDPNKVFGFIEGAYVPGSMLYGLSDGDVVSAMVIKNDGNRWHALFLYRK